MNPTIQLSTTPNRLLVEHNICLPVTLTIDRILFTEDTEDTKHDNWFTSMVENLNLPQIPLSDINPEAIDLTEWDLDDSEQQAQSERVSELLYQLSRKFPTLANLLLP